MAAALIVALVCKGLTEQISALESEVLSGRARAKNLPAKLRACPMLRSDCGQQNYGRFETKLRDAVGPYV